MPTVDRQLQNQTRNAVSLHCCIHSHTKTYRDGGGGERKSGTRLGQGGDKRSDADQRDRTGPGRLDVQPSPGGEERPHRRQGLDQVEKAHSAATLSRGGHQDTGRRTAGETPRGHQENTGLASAAKGGHEEGPQAWDTGFGQTLGENPNRKLFGENLIALIREWFKDLAEFLLWCRKADIPPFPSAIGIVAIGKKPTKESETDEKAQQN